MLIVVSPAKKLDFESENMRNADGQPALIEHTKALAAKAKTLHASDLKAMMGISDNLADLNVARFKAFTTPFTAANARPAIDAFQGDVYQGLDVKTLSDDDLAFAQGHLRILSGLYGLLRPLDLMQAYRLEMGVKFGTDRGTNLYHFWDTLITEELNKTLAAEDEPVLVNLASGEYFKSVKPKALKARIITPNFKDVKDGKSRIVSFLAKKARGLMTRYAITNRITDVNDLKNFNVGGYEFDPLQSTADSWIFSREQP